MRLRSISIYCTLFSQTNAASLQTTLSRTDSDEWKEFVSKPSLKYILRFLTGLATDHERTQLAVAATSIPVIHRLEQVCDHSFGQFSSSNNFLEILENGEAELFYLGMLKGDRRVAIRWLTWLGWGMER